MARRQVPKFIAGGALACLPLIAGGAYLMQARPARPAAEPQSEQRGGSAQRIAYVIGNTAYREMREANAPQFIQDAVDEKKPESEVEANAAAQEISKGREESRSA